MGAKSKAEQYGLKELIAEKWDGGKKTIVYVTEEVNEWLKQNGYKITVSREAVRHAIRGYEDEIADVRKGVEISKAMAEVFKDHPGTEQSEAMLMCLSGLVTKELRNIESINFEDPAEMVYAAAKLAQAQAKLSQYRTQAVKALDKAKEKIKAELREAIRHDPELLQRLCAIVDDTKVK
jgi:rhamnose utilization protein RhaD (predicted bifunctional aldolase and dehydrogenase)